MVACRSTTDRKTSRFSRCLESLAKKPSTALRHEHEVGVKRRTKLHAASSTARRRRDRSKLQLGGQSFLMSRQPSFLHRCGYRPACRNPVLLFAVLLRMSLACVVSVIASVGGVTVGSGEHDVVGWGVTMLPATRCIRLN
jgi:hypothetical protein